MVLAEIFSNDMIFQRNKQICIFGTGDGKGKAEFCGNTVEFESQNGEFRAYLPPMEAGGPYELKVTLNGAETVFTNILVGDVYFAGGQSNMYLLLRSTTKIELEDNPNIRFFTEPHSYYYENHRLCDLAVWHECKGEDALGFSAIGYYFAKHLYEQTGVPVGVISCNWGSSRVDAWTSPEIVETEEYQALMPVKGKSYYERLFNQESWLYKNKLLNVAPFAVNGVLWYQGESNIQKEESVTYGTRLDIMIKNWRELWNDNLPFYLVQIMPFADNTENNWGAVRQGIEYVSKNTEKVYMTTLVKTGEAKLIHPTRKKKLSVALAKAVLCEQFGIKQEYCGPVYDKTEWIENGIKITFTHGDNLNVFGEYLEDTYVYNEVDVAFSVDYEVEGNTLTLTWEDGIVATRVSMGYSNNPTHNLYNGDGYLASPFNIINEDASDGTTNLEEVDNYVS